MTQGPWLYVASSTPTRWTSVATVSRSISGYFAYPRQHGGTEHHSRKPRESEREDSIRNLSLSDDGQDLARMAHWNGSPKTQIPKTSRKGKHHERKKPLTTTPRNQNPHIDIALRNLSHEISTSPRVFQALVQCFEAEVEPLRDWAEDYTLDTVWRNKVTDRIRRPCNRDRFESVAAPILGIRATLKEAVNKARTAKETWDDKFKIERQIRTAKKAILYSGGIIDLAERAAIERLTCKQLVFELEEARCLLDREKHPWICKSPSVGVDSPGWFSDT